ncbi:MAG: toll/interleukin-1 receptor domain-containing protein [Bacteroidia bacterium]|nr:toll/interleukin-1 receptor domain-containing protein [Bacteroidia bacterium]NNF31380.1 toll/interleukin-1 receptor domain-containing protein [Flavobacteriaceae bacterium]MBT8275953.1 toll/interleukin-1 receptor domain-containing protein [Bacteroidia bacterium]NNJ81922.1 toll/interleukin-1 receptor domain-containing protein [Flavobacteriaceae bacterium]NNK53028.1 toll/interleukin-1 receptor domain-containing protein [Flavobacteriaceae bacterium]
MTDNTIFFSYSRDNSDFVLGLAKELKDAGANVWLDQMDIKPGTRWDKSIETALKESGTLLVVLSKSAVASHNVMDEVSYALEEGKTVVPILLEECDVPFRLRRLQFADFIQSRESGMQTLFKALHIGEDTANKPTGDPVRESPPKKPAASVSKQASSSKKSNKATLLYVIGGILAVLVILYSTGVINLEDSSDDLMVNVVEASANDEEAWKNAQSLNTAKAYLDYAAKYSEDGEYVQEAYDAMDVVYNSRGIIEYSEGSGSEKENFFLIYKGGLDDERNTPDKGNYIISLEDWPVNLDLMGTDSGETGNIKKNQIATVEQVHLAGDKVYCTIKYHQE